jgi:hypothetical protein
MEPRPVRGSGICHGSCGGYGFPPELDVSNPIDEDMAEIIKTFQNTVVKVPSYTMPYERGGI